jgi:segregation and condensation protein A
MYRVQLENFEGPLDLLLFLIKKNEVDIYHIPVAKITKQYLEYVEIIQMLDLNGASDFILMAATLMKIKAQMLLPRPEPLDGEEFEDPRTELVQRLLEYQRYKEVALEMSAMEKEARKVYPRGSFQPPDLSGDFEPLPPSDVTLFDLISVFRDLLKRTPRETPHRIEEVPVSVEDQTEYILSRLNEKGEVLFTELLAPLRQRMIMIVTFVALLEMVRQHIVAVNQAAPFGEIWIRKT